MLPAAVHNIGGKKNKPVLRPIREQAISMKPQINSSSFKYLAVKTTGCSSEDEQISEIAVLEVDGNCRALRLYHALLDPEMSESVRISGRRSFADIAEELLAFLRGGIVYAYGLVRIKHLLNTELAACGRPPFTGIMSDVLRVARMRFPDESGLESLDKLAQCCGLQRRLRTDEPDAVEDAELAARAHFWMQGKRLEAHSLDVEDLKDNDALMQKQLAEAAKSNRPETRLTAEKAFEARSLSTQHPLGAPTQNAAHEDPVPKASSDRPAPYILKNAPSC